MLLSGTHAHTHTHTVDQVQNSPGLLRSRLKSLYHRLSVTELPDIPSVPELAKVHRHTHTQ